MIPSPERTARIIEWRESLLHLSDYHFFELIRMYLGEVKTPYNKQKLIEELSAFLRNKENGKNLVKLLTKEDIVLLAAIRAFALPTQEKLSRFFSPAVSFADLYEHLLNLEERLIVYRKSQDRHMVFALNPLVEPLIEPFLDESALLEENPFVPLVTNEGTPLSPLFLASVYSFFMHESPACKLAGTLKKRTELLIQEVFPFTKDESGMHFFETVFTALKNLSLLRFDGAELKADAKKWQRFALLPNASQLAYVCAAACGRFSRESLARQAQTVLDIGVNIPARGFSRAMLTRLSLLQSEKHNDALPVKKSRLASILNDSAKEETQTESADTIDLVNRMIDLGLLVECDSIFVKSALFENALAESAQNTSDESSASVTQNLLTIDADFSATLLPGASLGALLSLMQFLHVTSFDTVPRFEITRNSCGVAFDLGETDQTLYQTLGRFSAHGLSQSLTFSLEDWYKTYSSASLYKGYVLKASAEKRALIENNALLAPYVCGTLTDGIYLLDFSDDEEASDVLKKCGLDFVGAVKQSGDKSVRASVPLNRVFLPLTVGVPLIVARKTADATAFYSDASNLPGGTEAARASGARTACVSYAADASEGTRGTFLPADASEVQGASPKADASSLQDEPPRPCNQEEADALFERMFAELKSRRFDEEQADGLRSRIKRRIILNPVQLRGDSVRFEKIEAGGMDFLGKVHIVDHAISSDSMIELEFADSTERILGTPLGIEKRTNDAIIKLQLEPEKKVALYSVSKAVRIKRIRGSIFKETGSF